VRKLVILVVIVAAAFTGCGGGGDENKIDTQRIERQISRELPDQISSNIGEDLGLDSIECIANNGASTAKCIAKLSNPANGDPEGLYKVTISVDVDPDTGKAIWIVDN